MPVSISGDGTFAGLTSVETLDVRHPDAADANIVLADDGTVTLDSIPAAIQSAIDGIPQIAGIGSNVVQTVKTDTFTTASTSYTAVTGLSVTITPTSATSKVLIVAQITSDGSGHIKFVGGNTSGYIGNSSGSRVRGVYGGYRPGSSFRTDANIIAFLDSPAVATPVTYSVEVQIGSAGGGTFFLNRGVNDDNNNANPRGASSITAIEVAP
jgi:hypothetical protein